MQPYRHSKLGQNRNLNNLSPSHHPKQQSPHCRNHPDKIATHSLISNQSHQQLNYCEKCSIMLASQNFNVIKITAHRPCPPLRTYKTSRQVQVEYFLGEIAQQIERIQHKKNEVENLLRSSEDNYARALAEITAYFKEIETIIQIQKYTAYNALLSQRGSVQSELRTVRESISSQLQGLEGISNDIENNIEAVLSVEEDIYQTIMQNYCTKLDISTKVEQIEVGHISQPLCLFAEVPKVLYSIAEGIQLRSNYMQPTPSPKRVNLSFKQSVNSSRVTAIRHDEFLKQANSQVSLGDIYRPSSQHLEEHYSFDNQASFQGEMQRVLFLEPAAQKKLLPHQVPFRESLNLTEIRENEDELMMRRFTSLEETIPQEMQSSRESLGAYLIGSGPQRLKGQSKGDSRAEDTQTLLIS